MQKRGQTSAFLVSLAINVTTLVVLHFFFHLPTGALEQLLAIESINEPEERQREDFEKQLDKLEKPTITTNVTPGAVSANIGGRSKTIRSQTKIEPAKDTSLREPSFTPGDQTVISPDTLGEDLGESEVNGDAQVLVKGYGPALDLIVQELIRLMRSDRLLVVWLFDESESMVDDQAEIKKRFAGIYHQLKIVDQNPEGVGISKEQRRKYGKKKSLLSEIMLTSVASFGRTYHQHVKSPTSKVSEVLSAMEKIPIDKTGDENTCAAIVEAIGRHKARKARDKRKLVIIVVSDESGDDEQAMESVIRQAKSAKSPIYVLGREAVFGSRFAHVRWRQKETGRLFYLPIRRGPETPYAELLQFDGFRRRYDSHMSGFGPYSQTRLCRDTGGIFFQLPHEDTNLNDFDERKYASYALREYLPDLSARSKYAVDRDKSKFRKAIWDVIALLNPYDTRRKLPELPDPALQRQVFPTDPAQYRSMTQRRGGEIKTLITTIEKGIQHLEKVKSLRAKEPSPRWRANYDLMLSQLYWYQLRLFEYGIGMDQFVRKGIPETLAKNPKHNRWQIYENGRKLVVPDALNEKRFKVTPEQLRSLYQKALARFAEVGKQHPGTPWASRAEWEAKRPFGVNFRTFYQPPPRGGPSRPRPKPTPPPKL